MRLSSTTLVVENINKRGNYTSSTWLESSSSLPISGLRSCIVPIYIYIYIYSIQTPEREKGDYKGGYFSLYIKNDTFLV
jgi:hypothetical protein